LAGVYSRVIGMGAPSRSKACRWAGVGVVILSIWCSPMVIVARALRPFADICNNHPLPAEGMALDISRITTGTSVAQQVNELDAVSATSADDTLLTIPVLTAAGQQKVSRQAIDRGRGLEDVLMQDLFRAYATSLDSQLITTASTGLSAVATATTYDDAAPTVAKLYPKVMGAMAGVEAALLNMGSPSHAVMHSRRWYWLASAMTSSWPFINTQGVPPVLGRCCGPDIGVRERRPRGAADRAAGRSGQQHPDQPRRRDEPGRDLHRP